MQVLGREGVVPFETFFTAGFGYDGETGQVTFPGQPEVSQVGPSFCPGFLAMALRTRSQQPWYKSERQTFMQDCTACSRLYPSPGVT